MRKLKIIEHISLDGVIQHSADDGHFPYSDWTAPYRTPAGRDEMLAAYGTEELSFGPEYLIPKPFDPRLMMKIAPAVAKAATDSGVALRPIKDYDAYREKLHTFVYASGQTMKPIFAAAKMATARRIA